MSRVTAAERAERILAMLPWIVEEQGASIDDLSRRFGLERKDLVADLDLLMYEVGIHPFTPDARVDVIYEDDRVYVHLGDYFRRPLRLTHEEGLSLLAAGRAVLARPGAANPALARAVDKLAAVLGEGAAEAVDVRLGVADPEVLATVEAAVADGRRLVLDYYSHGRDARSRREVDPVAVVNEEGHWYLTGWCHLAGGERVFRVDRIAAAQPVDRAATPPEGTAGTGRSGAVDLSDVDWMVEVVVDAADAWVADTFPTESVERRDDGRVRIRLPVTARPWLERLLLRLGPTAEARDLDSGESLAPVTAGAARRILARYGDA